MILFLFILFHTTWEQQGFGRLPLWASVDIFQSVTVEGIRNEKWRSFWTREMREGGERECEWKAFPFHFTFLFKRLLRRLFSSWKEFLLRSLHIFVKLCKLGSNVKSAPKTSVPSVPKQGPIDFPKRIHWIAIYPVDSAIQRLNKRSQISTILAQSPWDTYARPVSFAMFRCDCKVTWLQQHCKREGEKKGSRIFQSV